MDLAPVRLYGAKARAYPVRDYAVALTDEVGDMAYGPREYVVVLNFCG